jgi:hypothetical protein
MYLAGDIDISTSQEARSSVAPVNLPQHRHALPPKEAVVQYSHSHSRVKHIDHDKKQRRVPMHVGSLWGRFQEILVDLLGVALKPLNTLRTLAHIQDEYFEQHSSD